MKGLVGSVMVMNAHGHGMRRLIPSNSNGTEAADDSESIVWHLFDIAGFLGAGVRVHGMSIG